MSDDAAILACIPRLRRYARALVGSRDEADDLVQDTLERAWSRIRLLRSGSDPRLWLFSIMHNVFVDGVRHRSARPAERISGEALAVASDARGGDVLAVRRIAAALEALPPAQREVLLLVALEGLTYAEAAHALGIPVGTVMSRLSRARDALRVAMGEVGTIPLKVVE